jgi:hypothetical protein
MKATGSARRIRPRDGLTDPPDTHDYPGRAAARLIMTPHATQAVHIGFEPGLSSPGGVLEACAENV